MPWPSAKLWFQFWARAARPWVGASGQPVSLLGLGRGQHSHALGPTLTPALPQVVEETQVILREYGFRFVRRGPIFVKGKGELLTFFLKGRDKPAAYPNGSSVTLPHQVVDNP